MPITTTLVAATTTPALVSSATSRRVVIRTDADITILGDAAGTNGMPWTAADGAADFDLLGPGDKLWVRAATTANVNVLNQER